MEPANDGGQFPVEQRVAHRSLVVGSSKFLFHPGRKWVAVIPQGIADQWGDSMHRSLLEESLLVDLAVAYNAPGLVEGFPVVARLDANQEEPVYVPLDHLWVLYRVSCRWAMVCPETAVLTPEDLQCSGRTSYNV